MKNKKTLLATATILMLCSSGAIAAPFTKDSRKQFSLEVVVNGSRLPMESSAAGDTVIAPGWGTDYEIHVRNRTGRRVLAVVAVDGLSVMDGYPLSGRKWGYVLQPYSSVRIDGWRYSASNVTSFVFRPRSRSVAARHGHLDQIGTIELNVYAEAFPSPQPWQPRGAIWKSSRGDTGTGSGSSKISQVRRVKFNTGERIARQVLHYDTARVREDRHSRTPWYSGGDVTIPKHLRPF